MLNFLNAFRKNEEGASLIEYSLLIGLITLAAIVSMGLVSPWVGNQWSTLAANLPA